MLSTDTQTPRVAQTTVDTDLLQALQVLTQLVVQAVGQQLAGGAVLDVLLTVQEPGGDLVLGRVLHDGDDALQVSNLQVTSALAQVDVGLFADDSGEATADTLDGGQGKDDLLGTVDVGVQQTDDVLEPGLFRDVQRLQIEVLVDCCFSTDMKRARGMDGWIGHGRIMVPYWL